MGKVSKDKKVIAVVVTYNRKELLKECIEALLNQNYKNCDVLVVDNASTDGTENYIKPLLDSKRVIYKNTGSNLGGAGGFNYGLKMAYALKYEFFWLMDDDTMPYNNALEELMKAKDELKEFGFLSSIAEWVDGKLCNMNIQRTGISKKNLI